MSKTDDFLVEIGTEELPPKALRSLMEAFGESLATGIDDAHLSHGDVHAYASPRRLTVLVEKLAHRQEDRKIEQKGPPVNIAFDENGDPTPAATAFAKKCSVTIDELDRNRTDKGEWLAFRTIKKGKTAAELLPGLIERALGALPIPRRMRWGANDAEFVRPVHWVVLLHGKDTIEATIMGVTAARESRGHRLALRGLPGELVAMWSKENLCMTK
jgi:glycyl-tRNA synthetase beta chain